MSTDIAKRIEDCIRRVKALKDAVVKSTKELIANRQPNGGGERSGTLDAEMDK